MTFHNFIPLLTLGLITGIGLYFSLPSEPSALTLGLFLLLALLFSFALLAVCYGQRNQGNGLHPLAVPCLLLLAAAVNGFLYAAWDVNKIARKHLEVAPVLDSLRERQIIYGEVEELETFRKGGWTGKLRLPNGLYAGLYDKSRKLSPDLIGCMVELSARLLPPSGPATLGGYNPRSHAFFLGRVGRVAVKDLRRQNCPSKSSLMSRVSKWRTRVAFKYVAALPPDIGALSTALLFGFRGALPENLADNFRSSGLAHMLAISGLHMALFVGGLYAWVRLALACLPRLGQNIDIRKPAALIALAGALAYLLLSGASFATQRAFIMIGCLFVAIILRRPAITIHTACVSAFIILLFEPSALRSAGFLMSYAAVISLIVFYQWWQKLFAHRSTQKSSLMRSLLFYFIGLSLTSIVAGFASGLISVYYFERVASLGLVANLLAMPVFAFWVMPFLALSFLLLNTPAFGPTLYLAGIGLELIARIAGWVSELPGAVIPIAALPDSYIAIVITIFMGLAGYWWRGRGRWVLLGLVVFIGLRGFERQPDIYVLGRGREIAFRGEDSVLRLAKSAQNEFMLRQWFEREGRSMSVANDVVCGRAFCRLTVSGGWRVDVAYSENALAVACKYADAVISPLSVMVMNGRDCKARLISTAKFATRDVHIVFIDGPPSNWRVLDTALAGQRPWHHAQF